MNDKEKLFSYYKYALQMLETEINILMDEFVLKHGYNPVEHIKSRIKSEDSIKKKLKSKGYSYTASNIKKNIHDVVGIRIVVSFLSDVYDIVSILRNSQDLIIVCQQDYIKEPKDTGYISYNINVLIPVYLDGKTKYIEGEIQVRTIAMDFWASLEHQMHYKQFENNDMPEIVGELTKCAENIYNTDVRMQELREDIVYLTNL